MAEVYLLEWMFTPADYFEEPVDFSCDYGSIHVENGKANIHVPADIYPLDHSMRNQLHAELDARFLAVQVLAHKPYTLSMSTLSKLYPDGRKDAWVFAEAAIVVISGGTVDFILKDNAGNVIRDSRRERIEHRIKFAQLASCYISDAVANSLLRSYAAAVNDPRNELVHLYEIRDALSQHFRGKSAATSAIGITDTQWDRLGLLANNEPFTQGRHRGRQLGSLRDATESELSEVREIARGMVEGYLRHLEKGARERV